jgi:hypothetical protein
MSDEIETASNPATEDKLDDMFSMEGYDRPVRRARIILFIVAALQAIPIFTWVDLPEPARTVNIAINVFQVLVFCALALWTVRKPFNAVVGGLIFFSLVILFYAILDPATIIGGLLIKVVVYVLLIVGLSNAKDVQRWKDSKKFM